MIGKDLDKEMITKISEMTGIEKSKLTVMDIDNIKFYISVLTVKISSLEDFEDENEIDYSTGLELLGVLENFENNNKK
jgi:hypothetical protein